MTASKIAPSKTATVSACLTAFALARGSAAWAGGSVEGTVKLEGPAPKLESLKVVKDAAACGGAEKPNETLLTGAAGTLRNVVVSLKRTRGVTPAAPPVPLGPTPNAEIDQEGCQYRPHVQAVTVGTAVTVVNSDRVLHNVHANVGPIQIFNVAMPIKGQRLPTKLTRPGIVRLQCDAGHTWMNAYIHVFEHAHFAVTDTAGRFEIKDVPPGEYTLEYWHESIDGKGPGVSKTAKIVVKKDGATKADATLKL